MRFIKIKMGDQTNHANTAPVLESLLSIGIAHHKPCCQAPPLSQYTLSYSSFCCSLLFTYGYNLRIGVTNSKTVPHNCKTEGKFFLDF